MAPEKFCNEHCELLHTVQGDGKSNPGLAADYYQFKAYVNAIINKFIGGFSIICLVWGGVETVLRLHGKL